MTYDEIRTAWNAQADDGNKWDSLSEAEKIEWAAIHAAAKARGPAPIFNSAGWRKLESLQRKGFRVVGYTMEHCNILQDARSCTVDYNGLVRWVPSAEQEVAKERAARQAAQIEVAELKERIARAGVEQRRAVSEAVREAVQAAPAVTSAEQSRELLECAGCGHLYEVPGISACCCGNNPRNEYTEWVAVPKQTEGITPENTEMIRAFEIEHGVSWKDKDWRRETSVWASAWHKATNMARAKQSTADAYRAEVHTADCTD